MLARAREKGLDDRGLRRARARPRALPEFVAAGLFLRAVPRRSSTTQSAIDYADLIRRATAIRPSEHRDELRARFTHVFVDEYQDTDPGQVALLRALAGDGRDLTVVGDPHQSIYGFRGAEVRGILDFPDEFPAADGAPAQVVALRTHPPVRAAAAAGRPADRRPASPLPGTIPEAARAGVPAPVAESGAHGDGRVEVRTFDTERAEAEHLADLLRRAHLEDGIAWDDMAVLVRSGRTSIPPLRRSLGARRRAGRGGQRRGAAGARPGRPAAARRAAGRAQPRQRRPRPRRLPRPRRAARRCCSARSAASTPATLRRSARRCAPARRRGQGRGARPAPLARAGPPGASSTPTSSTGLDGPEVDARPAPSSLLLAGAAPPRPTAPPPRRCCGRSGPAPRWPERLRRAGRARRRRPPGAPTATSTRSCALFEAAARAEERATTSASRDFLATLVAQQIPGDTLAERGVRGAVVRLLTAHRAKGLEWRLVVVAHVQQDGWPDLRRRSHPAPRRPDRRRRPGAAGQHARAPRPRSAGSSTSPAPAPASGWWSPRSRRPTTTASSRPGSSASCRSRPSQPTAAARAARSRWRAWSATCAAPRRPRHPARAGARPPRAASGPGAGVGRRAVPGAAGRPRHLVGHPGRQPLGPPGARPADQPVPLSASTLTG